MPTQSAWNGWAMDEKQVLQECGLEPLKAATGLQAWRQRRCERRCLAALGRLNLCSEPVFQNFQGHHPTMVIHSLLSHALHANAQVVY